MLSISLLLNGWQPCHYGRQSVVDIFVTHWIVALSLWKVVCCRDFCYSMDGIVVIMNDSLLSIILLVQWMVALSLWNVVCCQYFGDSNGWQPYHFGRQFVVEIFVTLMDSSHVIIEGSLFLRFCYSNGWWPFHYGRQSVGELFFTPMDGSLVIMEGSLLWRFLLLQWMVPLSLWKVVCCRHFFYTTRDCSLVIMEGSVLSIFLLFQWMVALSLWKVVYCRYF